ncbi:MAG TPA: alpha/beta fold hydrolase [Mycobacteriales bacterium]
MTTIFSAEHGTDTGRDPLLLSHGYGSSSTMWDANLAALGAGRRVLVWDLPGHGHSGSPEDPVDYSEATCIRHMTEILDNAGVARAVIGGLSLGGYLSLAFHLAHPDRVRALLLFDTGPGFKRDDARQRWNDSAERRAVRLERDGAAALGDSPEVRGSRQDPVGLARAARGTLTQKDARIIRSLPTIAVPTLVVVGADDTNFRAAADYMSGTIPGAELAVIPDAGHAANIDQPEAFNRTVVSFLDRLD